jgi:hypothetical protein
MSSTPSKIVGPYCPAPLPSSVRLSEHMDRTIDILKQLHLTYDKQTAISRLELLKKEIQSSISTHF